MEARPEAYVHVLFPGWAGRRMSKGLRCGPWKAVATYKTPGTWSVFESRLSNHKTEGDILIAKVAD